MASFNGFLRKSPSQRLEQFFRSRHVEPPTDFDWTSDGRGTAFVDSVNALLSEQSVTKQDTLKGELEHLKTLADPIGLTSSEQICAGQGIDLEPFDGIEDILLMLAVDHPNLMDRVSVQASLMRRYGGQQWSAFQFDDDGKPWALDSQDVQATIYVEQRPQSELAFGSSDTLERQIVPKVVEVGLACNAQDRVIEICAKGSKKVRDKYAEAFSKHFAPDSATPIETPRRDVDLDTLRSKPTFQTTPADGIEQVKVSALDFFASGGGFSRFEVRGDDETIYQFLDRKFGPMSPLKASGWRLTGATIRIVLAATEGKRRKTLTVTLRTPNTTTLPNKTEKDRQFVFDLLERWNLIAPRTDDEDLIAAE